MSQKETKTNSKRLRDDLRDDKAVILAAVRKDDVDLKPVGPVDPKPWENEAVLEAFRKYGWTLMYIKEMERFDEVCGDLGIEHTDSLFGKFSRIRAFVKSKTYGFTLTESELKQLREKAKEALKDENVKRIIEAYEAKGFDITGEDIEKSIRAKTTKEIIEVCKAEGVEITGSDLKQLLETEEEKENEQGRSR